MDALRSPIRVTEEDYFAYQDTIEGRAEYFDGLIVDMAGGSLEHANISAQIGAELVMATRGKGCRVYTGDVKIATANSYLHPDVAVICGEPEVSDLRPGIARNPRVIVEVLSESTSSRDRGEKFNLYKELSSLEEYVMVDQNAPSVYVLTRSKLNEWIYKAYHGLDAQVRLISLNLSIPMSGIYDGVDFREAK